MKTTLPLVLAVTLALSACGGETPEQHAKRLAQAKTIELERIAAEERRLEAERAAQREREIRKAEEDRKSSERWIAFWKLAATLAALGGAGFFMFKTATAFRERMRQAELLQARYKLLMEAVERALPFLPPAAGAAYMAQILAAAKDPKSINANTGKVDIGNVEIIDIPGAARRA
jgi:hypothetical protein